MPAIQAGAKVLVTGANGYLGMWAMKNLLERGYSVRGTVRSASKATYVQEYYKSYGARFEIAYVEDFTKEGAFDESLVGVDGVLHIAAPMTAQYEDPEDYIRPNVDGTLGIMKSALKAPSVKRLIYTSTTAVLTREVTEPTVFTDKDWNDEVVEYVKQHGKNASTLLKYFASKVIAEKSAWEFYEKNKRSSGYDFLVIHPPFIFGPPIHELGKEPGSMGGSMNIWYNLIIANPEGPRSDAMLSNVNTWADVRDLAVAHVTALGKEEAAGERIIVVGADSSWQEWIDAANEAQNKYSITRAQPLPKGNPGLKGTQLMLLDNNKEVKILGTKFRGIHETVKDILEVLAKNGW